MSQDSIRNFCVISHIDHGKTTLTDRFLELTRTVSARDSQDRLLDSNPIERERGITIKLTPVRMEVTGYLEDGKWKLDFEDRDFDSLKNQDFKTSRLQDLSSPASIFKTSKFILNLIDTPGHVDFSYEVSRSLAACEGAVLLVDATQGIQAQTIANAYLALDHNLTIIPVINKIDLPSANPQTIAQDLINTFGFKAEEVLYISAKTGQNVPQLLEAIINRVPPPQGVPSGIPRALVFNSHFDPHRGVIIAVRVVDGTIKPQVAVKFFASGITFSPKEIGVFTPKLTLKAELQTGEVGYIATGLKDVALAKVGDTITQLQMPNDKFQIKPLPGYREPKPVVFMEFYPVDGKDYNQLKDAIAKLKLNDAALSFEPSSSAALGHGVRVGFLGLLHAEIVQERLEREFDLHLIATTPTVTHLVTLTSGENLEVRSAADLPDPSRTSQIQEPYITLTIFTPEVYLGNIISITTTHRATLIAQEYFGSRLRLKYHMPLSELVHGYYDELKSASSGFASLDYELTDYRPVDAVKLEILVNREPVPPLSTIVVRGQAEVIGRHLVAKLKTVIPRQLFEVPLQAAVGGKIIARATLKAWRKDVTAKLYGGDQTRKDKLLKKQKKGKKRMRQFGKVDIPQEAFLAVLKR